MSIKPKRSLNAFDLSHEYKGTCNMGWLIPVLCQDVIPGDTMDLTTDVLVRMEALIAPVMHRYHVSLHTFYLTERAMMPKDHENFITGGKNGDDDTVWPHQVSPEGGYLRGSLGDYLGYPCSTLSGDGVGQTNQISGTYEHSAYPMRMYAKIFNQYYINENIQDEIACSEDPGLDVTTNTDLLRCNWKKDYFTSALDDTQRGDPVYIPIGTSAPVVGTGSLGLENGVTSGGSDYRQLLIYGSGQTGYGALGISNVGATITPANVTGVSSDPTKSGLQADLSQAVSAPYEDFRKAARVNYLLELNKRAGYRIVECTLTPK